MNTVLIVDASTPDTRLMASLLTRAGYKPIVSEEMGAAKEEVAKLPPGAVVVAAMKFRCGTAQELINWQKRMGYKFPVIAIVENLNGLDIVNVMKDGGAVNVIQRPAIDKQLLEAVGKYAKSENPGLLIADELIPRKSEAFRKIVKSIETIAATNANCIIFGECGTGKEQIAKQIYHQSSRAQKPCTVIEAGGAGLVGKHNPNSDRSEIYNRIESYFKKADGGTIILKNIQLLTFEKQSVLLHILENEHPNVHVICTANASLPIMIAEETFRDSLFFVLRQTSIHVPPLRETSEDIAAIADFMLSQFALKSRQPKKRLDASAVKALKLHSWPGNIRELKDAVLFAASHVENDVITESDIKFDEAIPDTAEDLTHRNPMADRERILKAFKRAGTWRGASQLLKISEKALLEQRKKHHINRNGEIEV